MRAKLKVLVTSLALMAAAGASQATPINVGGVVWDPDKTGIEMDFSVHGTFLENAVIPPGTTHVVGRGLVNQLNSVVPNQSSFCPGCELTYTFSMDLDSFTSGGGLSTAKFKNVMIDVWVDHTPDYTGSYASAADGVLWLSLAGNGLLTSMVTDFGTGDDQGSGSVLLDVVGGLAKSNFDTNTKSNGADFLFTSSFQPAGFSESGVPMLTGSFDLKGNSIPEPGALALAGIALLGVGALPRRKSA